MGKLSGVFRIVLLLALGLLAFHLVSSMPAEGMNLTDSITRWDINSYTIDIDTLDTPLEVEVTYDWEHRYDIDLFLLGPDGDLMASAETQDEGSEGLSYKPSFDGVYILKVVTYETFWDPVDYNIECSHMIEGQDVDIQVELAQNETFWLYIDTSDGSGLLEVRARWQYSYWGGRVELYIYADGKVVASNTTPSYNEQINIHENFISLEVNQSSVYALSLVDTRRPPDQWTHPDPKVVELRSSYGLFLHEFDFMGEVTSASPAWFELEMGIPDKAVTITIEDSTNIEALILELYNPHGHRYTRTGIIEDEEMTMLLSGIVGTYSLRVRVENAPTEASITFVGVANCLVREIDPGLTSVQVGEEGTKLRIMVNSYQRPLEVSLEWDDPSVTLFAFLQHEDGEDVPSSLVPVGTQGLHGYYPTLVFGGHILVINAEGLEPGEEVTVQVTSNYLTEMARDEPTEDGFGSLLMDYLIPLLVFTIGIIVIIALVAARSRGARAPKDVVGMENIEKDKSEEPAEDKARAVEETKEEPPRNYCAFCGLKYKDNEQDKCPDCGRLREEG